MNHKCVQRDSAVALLLIESTQIDFERLLLEV